MNLLVKTPCMFCLSVLFAISLLLASPCWAGVDFDGVDDELTIASISANSGTATSASVWINLTSTPASGSRLSIIESSNNSAQHNFTFEYQNSGGTLRFLTSSKNSSNADWSDWASNVTLSTGTWYNVALTMNNTTNPDTVNFHVNGTQYAASNVYGTNNSDRHTGTKVFNVGEAVDNGRNSIVGKISEVAWWDGVVLGQGEINLLYAARVKRMPLQIQPSSLRGYWPLDDEEDASSGDADSFKDLSSNNNTLTGDDGANNLGLTAKAEEVLSYP